MITTPRLDVFGVRRRIETASGPVEIYSLPTLQSRGFAVDRLPFSLKVLLEALLRSCNNADVTTDDVVNLARWDAAHPAEVEIPFKPARVVLQDFTGVPAVVDLAAMRSAIARLGGDPRRIEPLIPAELVVDHSVQVDVYGVPEALRDNMRLEFERNRERYELLKWGQQAFETFKVVPPGVGIVHQVNLELLARGVFAVPDGNGRLAYFDSLVGADSHTTMINGLGIVGWGVGGIEAEAAMLGQPLYMLLPEVVGVRVRGALQPGATATDIALAVTQMLRKHGVVNKFVEFFGPGLSAMTLPDRATIANMAPEYGATMGFFPLDAESLRYLATSGRTPEHVDLVERVARAQGVFRTDLTPDPEFTTVLELDLGAIEPSLAGPKRPQDRVRLSDVKSNFAAALSAPADRRGFGLPESALATTVAGPDGTVLRHGSVVIAAITSCTNTSNPSVMLGAGLLARRAVERGLAVPSHVKTSLAPGSRVVTDYLDRAGLTPYLERLGFHTVGYGCTTCIGNSGPLPEPVAAAVREGDLVAAAVLSGNRNFEGRINPLTRANYLASPPLVVAYALAGTVDLDLTTEPLGTGRDGQPVFLRDLWPSPEELQAVLGAAEDPDAYRRLYADLNAFNPDWNAVATAEGLLYDWKTDSTYIQEPPFFVDLPAEPGPMASIEGARALAVLGDSVTTDHISPAGSIAIASPAGQYLVGLGVDPADFNSYGARRGNDRVMVRGTFANIRLRNALAGGKEGWHTVHLPSGEPMSIYDAAMRYRSEGTPLVVLAGKEYGTGSSRDWAAKGTLLLGVRAVLAESFERIHRSNLVGMGVLPLQYLPGESAATLGLDGRERFAVALPADLRPRQEVEVTATADDGTLKVFRALVRIDTPIEVEYYRHGGILPYVLRQMMK
ncbi:MAG TPA: aconitate hydratase AcnA [Thermoanaerobaculaceae bacterium]|nr:aconitate hydratase AcnA [Thermoanaerobaculaceae bacterium]HRS17683.1 aconitate hydratase AcnA [Thermoanaerobaculaceae bacterium]